MRRIDIDEPDVPVAATVGQTLLRAVVGMIVAAHGVDKLLHLRAYQGELIQLGIPNAETIAQVVIGLEIAAGTALLIGRLTRTAAFLVLCDAIAVFSMIAWQNRARELITTLEAATLMAAAAFYFLSAGSGVFSADSALRRRAQLKALRDDEIWSRYPYVDSPDGTLYEAGPTPEVTPSSYEPSPDTDMEERRRRILARHTGSRRGEYE